jgi:hypothetical protein
LLATGGGWSKLRLLLELLADVSDALVALPPGAGIAPLATAPDDDPKTPPSAARSVESWVTPVAFVASA